MARRVSMFRLDSRYAQFLRSIENVAGRVPWDRGSRFAGDFPSFVRAISQDVGASKDRDATPRSPPRTTGYGRFVSRDLHTITFLERTAICFAIGESLTRSIES